MAAAECEKHPVRWLTVEDIRKQQRMRRETVIAAMLAGELPSSNADEFVTPESQT